MSAVSIIGLGKLGLPLAAVIQNSGVDVIGVDRNRDVVNAVNEGRAPFYEPGLDDLLPICATTNTTQAIMETDATIILVATPSQSDGAFSLNYVLTAVEQVGMALRNKRGKHLVIVSSTVNPGDCAGPIRTALEFASGSVVGVDIGLSHVPEFVALGETVNGFSTPAFVIIGADDEWSMSRTQALYRRIVGRKPIIYKTSLVNAETAKIALNCYLTTKIAFANQIATLCERLDGGNAAAVLNAISLDPRVNGAYLKPGAPYGGPCFPRDDRSLTAVGRKAGADTELAWAVSTFNERHLERLADAVNEELNRIGGMGYVGVLGLAFKPGTDCTQDSPGMWLQDQFGAQGYDPLVTNERSAASAQALVDAADVVIVTTAHKEWKALKFRRGQSVIDCWRLYDAGEMAAAGVRYLATGVGR